MTSRTGLLTGVAAAVLALPANPVPATAAGPRVSLAEAMLALPTAASLPPGRLTEVSRESVPKPTSVAPCNLAARSVRLALHDNGAAVARYSTPSAAPTTALTEWVVSVRVFASTSAAHATIARLGVAEKSCPSHSDSGTTSYERNWSARYVAGPWHGYHTVDVITTGHSRLRHIAVYLQRGNALIQVDEIASVTGRSSPTQEARRLLVQRALAARVDAALAG